MSSSGCPTEKDTREHMKETEAFLRFSESICRCSLRKGGRAEAGGESNSGMDEECLLISLPLLQAKKKRKDAHVGGQSRYARNHGTGAVHSTEKPCRVQHARLGLESPHRLE